MLSAQLIREARRRAGVTQRDLARRLGTSQSAIARLEAGAAAPSLERLREIVGACDLELRVRLVPHDDSTWTIAASNRSLDVDSRIRRLLTGARATGRDRGHEVDA